MSETGKIVRVGQLRKRVKLQSYADSQTGTAEVQNDFATIATIWAQVTPIAGLELKNGKNTDSQATHDMIVRYRADITTEQWIEYDGANYRIRSVQDAGDARKRYLTLSCEYAYAVGSYDNPNSFYADPTTNEFTA